MGEFLCTVEQGQLKGQQERDIDGKLFVSFHGIPYAKPPQGQLRFKDPQEPDNWQGVRDATQERNIFLSYQLMPTPKGMQIRQAGDEDGLFLNVFTHKLSDKDESELRPVMFFIHGGGFISGSSSREQYGPEILMTEDIVLVTINYRVGALGFLSFEDLCLEVSGNAGLKDQVQALKWVKWNIKAFGGDPDNVTIFGESAGAASVQFLILSPLAKGLFHKAIMQSGSALNPWAHGENSPKKLAKVLGYNATDEKKILDYLQFVSGTKILEGQEVLSDWFDAVEKRPFSPSIEEKSATALISEDAVKILASGNYNKVPMMMGYNNEEGIIVETGWPMNLDEYVPHFFGYKNDDPKFKEINKKICQFYYGSDTADLTNKQALYKLFTDILFLRGIHNSVKVHAETSDQPVYYYRMSLDTQLNMLKTALNLKHIDGAAHADDLGYLFKSSSKEFNVEPGSREEIGYKRFVKMWTNFAKVGEPIPAQDPLLNAEWKPVTESELNFLDIGTDLVPGTDPDIDRMRFWDELYKDFPGY